jgi:hypothetical protein
MVAYLQCQDIKVRGWVAIDDVPELYSKGCPVIIADPDRGFDAECAIRLREYLELE